MKKWLSVPEVAAALDVDERRVRNQIFLKKLPFHKFAQHVRISAESLARFIELSQKVSPEEAVQNARRGHAPKDAA